MERMFLFLGLLYFCCPREAAPTRAISLVNPHHVHMVERALETTDYPAQDVDIEKICIELGRGVHYAVVFNNRGQRCYLRFSIVSYSRTRELQRLICDSPCPRGQCEVDDMLFNRLDSDMLEGRAIYEQERVRKKGCGGLSCRKSHRRHGFEHRDAGDTNYGMRNKAEGINELILSQFVNDIVDVKRPHHDPNHLHRPAVINGVTYGPQRKFESVEPYDSSEETRDLYGPMFEKSPPIQSIDGYESLGDLTIPMHSMLDGSNLRSVTDSSRYSPTAGNHKHRRGTRRRGRGWRRNKKGKGSRWNELYGKLFGAEDGVQGAYVGRHLHGLRESHNNRNQASKPETV